MLCRICIIHFVYIPRYTIRIISCHSICIILSDEEKIRVSYKIMISVLHDGVCRIGYDSAERR